MNIQFAVKDDILYVLEVNPRASRTVPFVSKATGLSLAKIATRVMLGQTLDEQGLEKGVWPEHISVKEAVFPFNRFPGVDTILGPEMKSTGEVMGINSDFGMAYAKSQFAAGQMLPSSGTVFISVRDRDKKSATKAATRFHELGFKLVATKGTAEVLKQENLEVETVNKVSEGSPHIIDLIKNGEIDLIINTAMGSRTVQDSTSIRRTALLYKVPYVTTLAGALTTAEACEAIKNKDLSVKTLQEYHQLEGGEFMNFSLPRPARQSDSGPKEACGVFGVFGHPDAAKLTYFGLYALQHRGQESAGIVASDGRHVCEHRGMGLVPDVFNEQLINTLKGHMALGHVRYSTTGSSLIKNAQPFLVNHGGNTIALGHNGNLTNALALRTELEKHGSILQTTMDTEVIVHLMVRHLDLGPGEALRKILPKTEGAYSLGLMTRDALIAARDPYGFRPLCLGRLANGAWVISSETCALDLVEAEYVRDVEPGEIVVINENGPCSLQMEVEAPAPFAFLNIFISPGLIPIFSDITFTKSENAWESDWPRKTGISRRT